METHVHTQVHWQPRRASVAATKVLQAGAVAAIASGFSIAVEAILINWIINTQKVQTLYSSTPHWSWWVGHAIFGVTLGLLSSVLLSRNNVQH
jgi:hypothetical protein